MPCFQHPFNRRQTTAPCFHGRRTAFTAYLYRCDPLFVSYIKFLENANYTIFIMLVFNHSVDDQKWFLNKWKQERSLPFIHSNIFLESLTSFKLFISHINAWLSSEQTSINTWCWEAFNISLLPTKLNQNVISWLKNLL